MANVYSRLLWTSGGYQGVGSYLSPIVPPGFVWDVRDVELSSSLAYPDDLAVGFIFGEELGDDIWVMKSPWIWPGKSYHHECRQIVEEGSQLRMETLNNGFSWRVSGYQLTLP